MRYPPIVDQLKETTVLARDQSDLLQGTLDLLILKTLSVEPMHGWGISQRIQEMSREVLQVTQGSLYPALQRLKTRGYVRTEWRLTELNRRARYYVLTTDGVRQLKRELQQWERSTTAVNWVINWGAKQ
jgi:transcriptional regulator